MRASAMESGICCSVWTRSNFSHLVSCIGGIVHQPHIMQVVLFPLLTPVCQLCGESIDGITREFVSALEFGIYSHPTTSGQLVKIRSRDLLPLVLLIAGEWFATVEQIEPVWVLSIGDLAHECASLLELCPMVIWLRKEVSPLGEKFKDIDPLGACSVVAGSVEAISDTRLFFESLGLSFGGLLEVLPDLLHLEDEPVKCGVRYDTPSGLVVSCSSTSKGDFGSSSSTFSKSENLGFSNS
eukprot:Gb_22160 [translate_table: standard]